MEGLGGGGGVGRAGGIFGATGIFFLVHPLLQRQFLLGGNPSPLNGTNMKFTGIFFYYYIIWGGGGGGGGGGGTM